MPMTATRPMRRRAPTRATLLAAVLAITTTVALIARAAPADAYTIDWADDSVTLTSERMHANTVYATVTIVLYSNGNTEFTVDAHNSARIVKTYSAGVDVTLPNGLKLAFVLPTRDIDGTWRSHPTAHLTRRDYSTNLFHSWDSSSAGTPTAHFWMQARWNNGGGSNPYGEFGCADNPFCEMYLMT